VIASTIGEKLPPGFQRSEFLLSHGMVDLIVPRGEMKATLAMLVMHLMAGKTSTTNGHAKHRERRITQ
jgi:acetyl-CoA carboxylase carboxyl transferase subunit beta